MPKDADAKGEGQPKSDNDDILLMKRAVNCWTVA